MALFPKSKVLKGQVSRSDRAKERQPPSLSNQTSFYTLSPEGGVGWNLPYGGPLSRAPTCDSHTSVLTIKMSTTS